jgi:wyosine [tRNA(Phe)-imidazoG37] synthetase (radical SAM superfamily)
MSDPPANTNDPRNLFTIHPRSFEENRYVYPVVSRRADGISIGVNLNLDKVCNFDCIYCQVDRTEMGEREFVELQRLADELEYAVELITSGRIYEGPRFSHVPERLRRLNDIALSGDGEPTTYRNFEDVVAVCANVRERHGLDEIKIVLITNASMFHRPHVQRGLELLDANNGEIWAKLDAGTEAYYNRVARSAVPFSKILDNLCWAAQVRPIVIQTLFMEILGEGPDDSELAAYCDRLGKITESGGRIKLVQVHTVARAPAEAYVSALPDERVKEIAEMVRSRTGLDVAAYGA